MNTILKAVLTLGFSFLANAAAASISVTGAGSTFAEPAYTKWFTEYAKVKKEVQYNYQGVGSGAGIKQLLAGTVDFAGSDDPMSAEDAAKTKTPVLHIPVAMGAVVASYNLNLEKPLKLTGSVLAKIFDGRIVKWNDKEIAALNAGVALPDQAIVVATRSDGSGTTAVFSDYLSKVSPEWVGKNGKTVKWFAGSVGAKGNAGVAGLVKQTPGTIGYVELVYALENKLAFATMQNKAGQFVVPSAATVSFAADKIVKEAVSKEFKVSLTDSDNKQAYPISSFTWMLVYETMPKEKGQEVLNFAKWLMSEEAQKIVSGINYAPVPKEIRTAALKSLTKVKFE